MKPHEKYRHIAQAALEIAYDNGGINRGRTEAQHRKELNTWLTEHETFYSLHAIDAFLGSLAIDDLQTVCCGEVTEADAILKAGPTCTGALLNDIFDNVC